MVGQRPAARPLECIQCNLCLETHVGCWISKTFPMTMWYVPPGIALFLKRELYNRESLADQDNYFVRCPLRSRSAYFDGRLAKNDSLSKRASTATSKKPIIISCQLCSP